MFTITNLNLFNHVVFWSITFSLGIGLLSGYLTAYEFCSPYNRSSRCYSDSVYQAGITAGGCLTAIGGFFGLLSCTKLGDRLKVAEQTTTTRTAMRNTTLTETPTNRNPGAVEFNSPRQEVRNPGTETDTNHEIIELSSLGQETINLEAETIDIEQTQNQQITELQRRLTQLENQINQQQEARIEVITS